jgi:hypothetical protein
VLFFSTCFTFGSCAPFSDTQLRKTPSTALDEAWSRHAAWNEIQKKKDNFASTLHWIHLKTGDILTTKHDFVHDFSHAPTVFETMFFHYDTFEGCRPLLLTLGANLGWDKLGQRADKQKHWPAEIRKHYMQMLVDWPTRCKTLQMCWQPPKKIEFPLP